MVSGSSTSGVIEKIFYFLITYIYSIRYIHLFHIPWHPLLIPPLHLSSSGDFVVVFHEFHSHFFVRLVLLEDTTHFLAFRSFFFALAVEVYPSGLSVPFPVHFVVFNNSVRFLYLFEFFLRDLSIFILFRLDSCLTGFCFKTIHFLSTSTSFTYMSKVFIISSTFQ